MDADRPQPSLPSPGFEFSGGDLALDFVNTWGDRGRPETDRLRGYGDLLAFARQGGLLGPGRAEGLARAALRRPSEARGVLEAALGLREALYRLLTGRCAGAAGARRDREAVNRGIRGAFPHLELQALGQGLAWSAGADHLEAVLWPVVRAAVELLASSRHGLVHECEAPDCTWLFLDRSRTGRRRWCSMASCGNRAKARRHYERRRTPSPAPGEPD